MATNAKQLLELHYQRWLASEPKAGLIGDSIMLDAKDGARLAMNVLKNAVHV